MAKVITSNSDVWPEPAWDIAPLFPAQGMWSEEDYLLLPTNRLVEFSHGVVEVLALPGQRHQMIVLALSCVLYNVVLTEALGMLLIAPFPVRLWPGKLREPDIVFMLAQHNARRYESYWEGADLVVEVVSPDGPKRDIFIKRQEYAEAGIPEYWIVDPIAQTILVLRLEQETYVEHGHYGIGHVAESVLLAAFAVAVDAVFSED